MMNNSNVKFQANLLWIIVGINWYCLARTFYLSILIFCLFLSFVESKIRFHSNLFSKVSFIFEEWYQIYEKPIIFWNVPQESYMYFFYMCNTVHTAKKFINEHCCEKYSKPSKTNIKHSTLVRGFLHRSEICIH